MTLLELEYSGMSDVAEMQSRSNPKRADKEAFAQVEKWMGMIREFDHERRGQTKTRLSDLAEFSTE
jgi:hypothetical protein